MALANQANIRRYYFYNKAIFIILVKIFFFSSRNKPFAHKNIYIFLLCHIKKVYLLGKFKLFCISSISLKAMPNIYKT